MNPDQILFHDETQLIDWGETRSGGPWVKLRLPSPESLEIFRGMDTATLKKSGHILHVTIAQGDIVPDEGPTRELPEDIDRTNGQKWRDLIAAGLFNAPPFLHALGTDDDYQAWCRLQPSAVSKRFSEYAEKDGEGRCVYAHDRRAGQDGTGYKNPNAYSGVPMTDAEHSQIQHQSGLLALMRSARRSIPEGKDNVQGAKDWMESLVSQHRAAWGKKRLCEIFEVNSRAEISMDDLWSWADCLDDDGAKRVLETMGVEKKT